MPTYADFVVEHLKGKLVQVYFGESFEQTHYDDSSRNVPATLVGKIVGGGGECIIVDCFYLDENKDRQFGNIQFVNSYNIFTITELDGHGSFGEALANAHAWRKLHRT